MRRQGRYPKLVAWVEDNIEETLTYYRLPLPHHLEHVGRPPRSVFGCSVVRRRRDQPNRYSQVGTGHGHRSPDAFRVAFAVTKHSSAQGKLTP